MTTNRALTIASAFILTLTTTALTFALVTATPREPRTVIQSPTTTLAAEYADTWDSLKTQEPRP